MNGSNPSATAKKTLKYIWYFGVFLLNYIMSKRKKKNILNPGHYLELMDRTYIVMENINEIGRAHV